MIGLKMLTRHFYELDEVGYALLYCLRHKRCEEAVFWAQELLLSQEEEILNKIMIQAWISIMGARRIDWLDAWFGGVDRLVLVYEFCKIGFSSSGYLTFWIAARGLSPVASEERVALALSENDPICLYWWLGSEYDKKPSLLLNTIESYVDSADIFASLQKAMKCKLSVQLRTLLAVCGVQVLCLETQPVPLVCTGHDFVKNLSLGWSVGRRGGRMFSITSEMLPRGCKRVLQMDGLCLGAKTIMAQGCRFWQNIGSQIADCDDITYERVVDTHFPDDIPDEWSVEDRAKSHPVKQNMYKVHIKHEYRIRLFWNPKRIPIIREAWRAQLTVLFKACAVPDT